jgi:hypothetical protein
VNTWLAIVVFCIQGECAFMVSSKQATTNSARVRG